MMFGASQT